MTDTSPPEDSSPLEATDTSCGNPWVDELFAGCAALLTVPELASVLNKSTQAIHKWITGGVLTAYKPGGEWLFITAQVKAEIASRSNMLEER